MSARVWNPTEFGRGFICGCCLCAGIVVALIVLAVNW